MVQKSQQQAPTGTDKKQGDVDGGSQVAKASTSKGSTSASMDTHPFTRGAVIEVIHIENPEKESDDTYWWSDSDDEEEKKKEDASMESNDGNRSIRLCDIIDRVPVAGQQPNTPNQQYRYYVHYRDFNRRMDEWVGMDRIVSPPSIGNAKARALKREQDKAKKEKEKQQLMVVEKSSRRRNRASVTNNSASEMDISESMPRMTRRLRRSTSTTINDDSTVVASNAQQDDGPENGEPKIPPPKEIVHITTASAVAETKVGQHVVATIPAQELDEHEGLDEASLREHEEVTKVKNVETLELGEYRMNTWYFSPLPKELLSERGYVETLYVCEFSFAMFARKSELLRYQAREPQRSRRHPPGNEIYRNGNLSSEYSDGFHHACVFRNNVLTTFVLFQSV